MAIIAAPVLLGSWWGLVNVSVLVLGSLEGEARCPFPTRPQPEDLVVEGLGLDHPQTLAAGKKGAP